MTEAWVSSPLYFQTALAQFGPVITRFGIYSLFALVLSAGGLATVRADTNVSTPDFSEVFQLIKTHAAGISETELNQAAVQGLIAALTPRVTLVTNDSVAPAQSPLVSKSLLFDSDIAYLRVLHVENGLADEVKQAWSELASTNRLKGLVLDLRYADGFDYSAAVSAADLFITAAKPLLKIGDATFSSTGKAAAIDTPVAILVNSSTSGSAEALAAVLRAGGVGLILGGKTSGEAFSARDYPLSDGSKLRIASTPVTLGNGNPVSTEGISPDIDVTVNPADERSYYADAFFARSRTLANASATNGVTGTNGIRRARFNEAELVREHRAGLDRDGAEVPRVREPEPEEPVVSDPPLARALDLLKGLAVVRQTRS